MSELPRRRVPGWVYGVGGPVVGGVAIIATGLVDLSAPVVVTLGVLAVVFGVGGYVHDGVERRKRERVEQARQSETAAAKEKDRLREIEGVVTWPLPLVAEADPFNFGVHRPLLRGVPAGQLGPYVVRDVDQRADEALRENGLLLLIGAPGSGVSRTAWELATHQTMNRRLLAPVPGRLEDAYKLDVLSRVKGSHLVLWLDRIDEHTDLTVDLLKRCQNSSSGLRVIATISTSHYDAWAAEHDDLAEHPTLRQVRVEQLLSPAERARAAAAYPGLDVSWGIGAAFTGLRSLLKKEQAGDHECSFEPDGANCAVARTVVHAACFWPTTGTPRPLTLPVITDAVTRRLGLQTPIKRAHLEHALTWATQPVPEGVSLLSLHATADGTQAVVAHQGLSEAVTARDRPDPTLWLAALDDADTASDSEAIGRIGYHAHRAGLLDIATSAWDRIRSIDEPGVEWIRRAADLSSRQHRSRHQLAPLARLLALTERKFGPDHVEVARSLVNLGKVWGEVGKAGKEQELLERALSILEREYGPDDMEVALTLTNLGGTWRALGQAGKARELHERALNIFEREFGPDHVQVARTLVSLGNALGELGKVTKERQLLERALPILEREYGPDHVVVAHALAGLGAAYGDLGQADNARDRLQRALPILEREYGPDHAELARPLASLGTALGALGEIPKGRQLLERALTIKEREYGPDHVEVARTLAGLAATWGMLGQAAKARDLLERALPIFEREYGPDHVQVARALVNLGAALRMLGQAAKARDLLERALIIFEREYGPHHVDVALTLVILGQAWWQLGQEGKAREFWERARRIYRAQDPPRPQDDAYVERLLRQAEVIPLADGSTAMPTSAAGDPETPVPSRDPATPD